MRLPHERVEFAALLVGRAMLRADAKSVLREKFGVDDAMARRLLRAAKKMLKQWINQDAGSHFLESASFYRSVIQSDARLRDKLIARERLDDLNQVSRRPDEEVPTSVEEAAEAIERIVRRYEVQADESVSVPEDLTYVP